MNVMNFQEIKETALELSRLPMIFGEGDYSRFCEGVRVYEVTAEQFSRIEFRISESEISGSLQDLEIYYRQRSLDLADGQETGRNCLGFCLTGVVVSEETITFYYITTSRTVLTRIALSDGTERYFVRIPLGRRLGFHDTIVNLILEGMTPEQYDRWLGAMGKMDQEYREFYNSKLCPLGFESLPEQKPRRKTEERPRSAPLVDIDDYDYSDYKVEYDDYDDEL